MAKEYISREAAIIGLAASSLMPHQIDDAAEALQLVPAADVVEVVRCRECIYYHDYTCDRWADGTLMEQTDYCSRAAKMDGGQDE